MRQRKGNGRMYNDLLAEEEERFTEALGTQESNPNSPGLAEVDDDPSAQIVWKLGNVYLTAMPPHVGRRNRFSDTFMDLLVLFMNMAKRRGDGERLGQLNQIYRSALGKEIL